jgi:hypothetical protein
LARMSDAQLKTVKALHRWLVARTWSVDKAEHSLRDHAAWRAEFPFNSVSEVSKCKGWTTCVRLLLCWLR